MTQPTYAPPDLAQTRAWTGAAVTSMSDEQLTMVLAAETGNQAGACTTDPYTADLHQAVLRRVGRELAARGIPLGMTPGSAEFGPARLAQFDAEIERLEGHRRRFVFG